MTTKKQIEANRRNAKKSTGPKSTEGKAKAARNALKHGLTSRQAVLSDEDGAMFEEMRRNLHLDLRPESQLELLLVNRIAAQQWRLARIPALEAELIDQLRCDPLGADEGLGAAWTRDAGPYGGALARLARYETAIERSLVRVLGELRKAQAERRRVERGEANDSAQPVPGEAARDGREWWERAAEAWQDARQPARQEARRADGVPGANALRNEPDGKPIGSNGSGTHGAHRGVVDPATADYERWLGDV